MSMRGVSKPGSTTITTQFTGQFDDPQEQARFISLVRAPGRYASCAPTRDQP